MESNPYAPPLAELSPQEKPEAVRLGWLWAAKIAELGAHPHDHFFMHRSACLSSGNADQWLHPLSDPQQESQLCFV